jgi:hypothetical protein
MTANEEHLPEVKVELNLDKMLKTAMVGIWRASAFLTIGLRTLLADEVHNFNLAADINYQFWPDPLGPDQIQGAIDEYQHWLVGSCLKELDQFFSLFLDGAWRIVEIAELHNQRVGAGHKFDQKFAAGTNVARKLCRLAAKLDLPVDLDCFKSLSFARNALTHGVGRVRPRDCNDKGALVVSWLAPYLFVQDGDQEVGGHDLIDYTIQSAAGAQVQMRIQRQSVRYVIGEKIELSRENLAQICWHYHRHATSVHGAILSKLRDAGIAK